MQKLLPHLIKQCYRPTVGHNLGVDEILINQLFFLFHTTSYPERQNSVAVYYVPQQICNSFFHTESVHVYAFGDKTEHSQILVLILKHTILIHSRIPTNLSVETRHILT